MVDEKSGPSTRTPQQRSLWELVANLPRWFQILAVLLAIAVVPITVAVVPALLPPEPPPNGNNPLKKTEPLKISFGKGSAGGLKEMQFPVAPDSGAMVPCTRNRQVLTFGKQVVSASISYPNSGEKEAVNFLDAHPDGNTVKLHGQGNGNANVQILLHVEYIE